MITIRRGLWVLALATCFGISVSLEAQKKPTRPPTSQAGNVVFRCPGADCPPTDRIVGDGTNYQGIGVPETGEGAHLNSNQEMWIGVGSGVYSVALDFSEPDGSAPCSSSTSPTPCRFPALNNPIVVVDQENGEFQSNVLDVSELQPSANGLLDLGIHETRRTRLKVSFSDPAGRSLLWGLNFNTIDYAGATNVNVTRINSCSWVFEPGPNDRGGLSAYGHIGRGKDVRTDEGLYVMPFRITFTVPAMCVP